MATSARKSYIRTRNMHVGDVRNPETHLLLLGDGALRRRHILWSLATGYRRRDLDAKVKQQGIAAELSLLYGSLSTGMPQHSAWFQTSKLATSMRPERLVRFSCSSLITVGVGWLAWWCKIWTNRDKNWFPIMVQIMTGLAQTLFKLIVIEYI